MYIEQELTLRKFLGLDDVRGGGDGGGGVDVILNLESISYRLALLHGWLER